MTDFFTYPPGSNNRYPFPSPTASIPVGHLIFTTEDNRQFSIDPTGFVLISRKNVQTWIQAERLSQLLAGMWPEDPGYYVTAVTLMEPVAVEAIHASGSSAEAEPVAYTINNTVMLRLKTAVSVSQSDMVAEVEVSARTPEEMPFSCACVLTNDPCGEPLPSILT